MVWNKGRKLTEAHKKSLSEARKEFYKNNSHPRGMLGKLNKWGHHSEETKKLIGEKGKGKVPWNKGKKLSPMTQEQKTKISRKLKGIIPWNKGLTEENNEIIKKSNEKNSESHKKSFREGKVQWNYIDGRSKGKWGNRYGCDWEKIRQLILRRDNFICQHCGEKKKLEIHHKVPFLKSFDNSLNNLITLCATCHRREEARIIKQIISNQTKNVLYN